MIDKAYFEIEDIEALNKEEFEHVYRELDRFNNYIYDFVVNYHKSIYKTKAYGGDEMLSMIEAHLITDIAGNPGITANVLAKKWDKTAAFISQTLTKLEKSGYIYRELNPDNRKFYNLYITEKGRTMDYDHKKYDIHSIIKTNKELMKKFSLEDLIKMRLIMKEYIEIINSEE